MPSAFAFNELKLLNLGNRATTMFGKKSISEERTAEAAVQPVVENELQAAHALSKFGNHPRFRQLRNPRTPNNITA